jgi:hypothetical protein
MRTWLQGIKNLLVCIMSVIPACICCISNKIIYEHGNALHDMCIWKPGFGLTCIRTESFTLSTLFSLRWWCCDPWTKVPRWNLVYHVCCSHVITTRSTLGILFVRMWLTPNPNFSVLQATIQFREQCKSCWHCIMSIISHEHTHHAFINMCIIMHAHHHIHIMCISHYAPWHIHWKFICINIICSYTCTSYYMHFIMSIHMCTIPLLHESFPICISIVIPWLIKCMSFNSKSLHPGVVHEVIKILH